MDKSLFLRILLEEKNKREAHIRALVAKMSNEEIANRIKMLQMEGVTTDKTVTNIKITPPSNAPIKPIQTPNITPNKINSLSQGPLKKVKPKPIAPPSKLEEYEIYCESDEIMSVVELSTQKEVDPEEFLSKHPEYHDICKGVPSGMSFSVWVKKFGFDE